MKKRARLPLIHLNNLSISLDFIDYVIDKSPSCNNSLLEIVLSHRHHEENIRPFQIQGGQVKRLLSVIRIYAYPKYYFQTGPYYINTLNIGLIFNNLDPEDNHTRKDSHLRIFFHGGNSLSLTEAEGARQFWKVFRNLP